MTVVAVVLWNVVEVAIMTVVVLVEVMVVVVGGDYGGSNSGCGSELNIFK